MSATASRRQDLAISLTRSLLLVATLNAPMQLARAEEPLIFAGQRVVDVLSRYEATGEEFIYSSDVLGADMRFQREPPPGPPLTRLEQALSTLHIAIKPANQERHWLIVPTPVPSEPPPAPMDPLRGQVIDDTQGRALVGVLIGCDGRQALTDVDGRFEFSRPGCVQELSAEREGYVTLFRALTPRINSVTLHLAPKIRLEELVVVASRYSIENETLSGVHRLDPWRLTHTPELGDDAVRIVNQLPSVASIGLSARPHVRGGAEDETLVLFDHVELLEPFHLRDFKSLFSSLNPSIIRSIDVFTGGFPVRYGDRMSGVFDITPRDDFSEFGGSISVSFLNLGAELNSAPPTSDSRWAAAVRRGTLDWVSDRFSSSLGKPAYSDGYAQWVYSINDTLELDTGLLAYGDNLKVNTLRNNPDGEFSRSDYKNYYAWAQLQQWNDEHSVHRTVLSVGKIDQHRDGFVVDSKADGSNGFVDDTRTFDLWQLAHRTTMEFGDTVNVDLGMRLHYQRGHYRYHAHTDRGDLALLLGIAPEVTRDFDLNVKGPSGGAYAAVRWQAGRSLFFEVGSRWDFQAFGDNGANHQQFSPRLSVRYDAGDSTQVRLSAGRYSQSEGIHELQVADGVTRFQSPQYADHFIVALDHAFSDTFAMRAEVFEKRTQHVKPRFDNLFDQLALLPELSPDRYGIAPKSGRAAGFELSLTYRPTSAVEVWSSYSLAYTDDRVNGRWQSRPWDQRNTLRAGAIADYDNWSLGATLTWHSGWRGTQLPPLVDVDDEGAPLPIDLMVNHGHLPNFFSLDVRVGHTWHWSQSSLETYAEVINSTNRHNIGAFSYEVDDDEATGLLRTSRESERLIPIIPSLGFIYRFE